jgi:hypothetical protein
MYSIMDRVSGCAVPLYAAQPQPEVIFFVNLLIAGKKLWLLELRYTSGHPLLSIYGVVSPYICTVGKATEDWSLQCIGHELRIHIMD